MSVVRVALALLLTSPLSRPAPPQGEVRAVEVEPPARALSRELSGLARLAGTSGSAEGARRVSRLLREAGWRVESDERVVLLSLPRRIEVSATEAGSALPLVRRTFRFDRRAVPPGDVPPFLAWSASGVARGPAIDVGRGLAEDYARIAAEGRDVAGHVALARYGGAYRGVKVELAERHGCAGVILFSDPAGDGAGRGPTWPRGRWKPGWAAQRGAVGALARVPGDPTTPGRPSPAPGTPEVDGTRIPAAELEAFLPSIPCTALGADDVLPILDAVERGARVEVELDLDVPRELAVVRNVLARLPGRGDGLVIAGNHRDAWVRGAQDAASGTVALLRAAQILGERARDGWQPAHELLLGFWDAEEFGLIGSTEWAEAHADELGRRTIAYLNADAVVGGTRLGLSGTPGLLAPVRAALERVAAPEDDAEGRAQSLWKSWSDAYGEGGPSLALPGAGSDFTVFLHHLGLPVLDFGFGGAGGGQYHTRFDDFALMDRFLDPTWRAHEAGGALVAELLVELAERGRGALDDAAAARAMAELGGSGDGPEAWLGVERAARLRAAFLELAAAVEAARAEGRGADLPNLYRALLDPRGLPDRPWYRNPLWAPGLDTGYAAERLPGLRLAAREGEEALDAELARLLDAVHALAERWSSAPGAPRGS